MRTILAQYLDVLPQQIGFLYPANGKPELAPRLREAGLTFNMSHSQDRAVFAVTMRQHIGLILNSSIKGSRVMK